MSLITNHDLIAMNRAYEAGRVAAFDPDSSHNPYSYAIEKALYWEWERGYRDCLYGIGK